MSKLKPEILEQAADLLDSEDVQWCRGEYATPSGEKVSYCAVGAINAVTGYDGYEKTAKGKWVNFHRVSKSKVANLHAMAVAQMLEDEGKAKGGYIELEYFNDKIASDRRSVTRALRRAARKIREGKLTLDN